MGRTGRTCAAALGCLLALSACQDMPTDAGLVEPSLNKGQDKKAPPPPPPGDMVDLGELVFTDLNLSAGRNQSCQTCHEPGEGFAAALPGVTTQGSVVQGSIAGRFGDRKPPSAAYASLSPIFSGGNNPTGGNFWDGRATGLLLGNPAADQALGPFLNPVEQALPHAACVVYRVLTNDTRYNGAVSYATVFPDATVDVTWDAEIESRCSDPDHGGPFFSGDGESVQRAFENLALAVAAFEGSDRVNRFSSRYDADDLTDFERQGEKVFNSKGKCQQCHTNKGERPLFTDFAYHNLGVPKNPANPVYNYSTSAFDPGLGGFTGQQRHMGKFRTPTTRNTARGLNRTYMHNGAIASLIQVVDFYNTRDVLPRCTDPAVLADPTRWGSTGFSEFDGAGCWPAAEHAANLDTKNMGKLGLTHDEVRAVVAYLHAHTDM
jgi:cytochrome c peroxidase